LISCIQFTHTSQTPHKHTHLPIAIPIVSQICTDETPKRRDPLRKGRNASALSRGIRISLFTVISTCLYRTQKYTYTHTRTRQTTLRRGSDLARRDSFCYLILSHYLSHLSYFSLSLTLSHFSSLLYFSLTPSFSLYLFVCLTFYLSRHLSVCICILFLISLLFTYTHTRHSFGKVDRAARTYPRHHGFFYQSLVFRCRERSCWQH